MLSAIAATCLLVVLAVCVAVPLVDVRHRSVTRRRPAGRSGTTAAMVAGVVLCQLATHCLSTYGVIELHFWAGRTLTLNIGSYLLFPINIVLLVYSYFAHSDRMFRTVVLSVVLANVVMGTFAFVLVRLAPGSYLATEYAALWDRSAVYKMVASMAVLAVDALALLWAARLACDLTHQRFVRLWLPTAAALVVDAAAFPTLVALLDHSLTGTGVSLAGLSNGICEQLVWKVVVGSLYAAGLTAGTARFNGGLTDGPTAGVRAFLTAVLLLSHGLDAVIKPSNLTDALISCYTPPDIDSNPKDLAMDGSISDLPAATEVAQRGRQAFEAAHKELLRQYEGFWVAYVGDRRLAIEPTLYDLENACRVEGADPRRTYKTRITAADGPDQPRPPAFSLHAH